jgi:hypothetical protein
VVHVTAVPPHAPFVQWSLVVQALPSLHWVPSLALLEYEHAPELGSHVPGDW